ncbi:MAG: TonB-dependent receptor [Candidatus Aminicenantes bacterium]|nr:TonB-dependent receptor [Candidatus Aminicenantes bacterium]
MFRKCRIGSIAILGLVIFTLIASPAHAQQLTGKVVGTVTDEEGISLPGVTVEISSPDLMGGIHSQITTEKGTFRYINLPPGVYKVIFKLEGFQRVERENIHVSVGATVTLNIALKQATLAQDIVVTAETPLIDVAKSGFSTNFAKEDLDKLPVGRFSHFDVTKMAPGVQLTSEYSNWNVAYGSNVESNAVHLDGVDITNPDVGVGWHYISSETFEEVEATGIGSSAEYGQFTGAVVNIVTKSGGNMFEGALSYYGQWSKLTADNNPEPDTTFSYHRHKFYYAAAALGGPIIKDKLWFFGNYEKNEDSASFWLSDPKYPSLWPGQKAFFKLSAQVTTSHKLVGSVYFENGKVQDTENPYYLPDALGQEDWRVPTWNFMYSWLMSKNAFFEVKYAGYRYYDDYLPLYTDLDTPPRYDWNTGVYSNGVWWPWKYMVGRDQVNANLTYYADDFLGAEHDFKVGVQYNRGTSKCHGGYPGGYATAYYAYDYYGYIYPYLYKYEQNVFYYGGVVNAVGVFVNDSVKIGDRLTVNVGLRFDHNNASIPDYPVMDGWTKTSEISPGIKDLITTSTWSPRIGFVYQLTSDHKTLLRASYGRYYDGLHMSNWNWPGPHVTDWNMYYYDYYQEKFELWYTVPGSMGYAVDPDYKIPHADQFSVGLEREFFQNFSMGANFIYKKEKDLIGWQDRGATYEQVTRISPDNGKEYTVWNLTSPLDSHDYWITNPPEYEQSYRALILTLTKRYANNWMLNASLTWSKSEGLNNVAHTDFQEATIYSAGKFGKDPNDLINAKGLLQFDRRWMFKLQASYQFPWEILASINYVYQTGTPAFSLVKVFGLNQDVGAGTIILAEPRNEKHRLDPWSMLDFRIEKSFSLFGTAKLSALFDVFNVLNANTATGLASYNAWADNYLQPNWIFFPRRLQIGIRLDF